MTAAESAAVAPVADPAGTKAQIVAPGPITASRAALVALCRAAGLPMLDQPTGRFATPCGWVDPAEPFLAPSRLSAGYRTIRWAIFVLAGSVDAAASWDALTAAIETATLAVEHEPGWSAPTATGPRVATVAGARYLAAQLTAETLIRIT
jgi:hypothetical protein